MNALAPLLGLLLQATPPATQAAGARPPLEAQAQAAVQAQSPSNQTDTAASSAIEAIGLVRAGDPGRSVAILRSQGRTRVVSVGEIAFGARLVAVAAETVTLDQGGRSLELRLTPAPPLAAQATRRMPEPANAGLPPEDPATPAREMDRRQVQVRLADEMTRILADTAIAPVMEDGHVVGVQLTRVPEGSLLTDAGLRPGDVITRINDTEIDGMASLIGLYPRLQSATELRAVVLRGGQPISLKVSLR